MFSINGEYDGRKMKEVKRVSKYACLGILVNFIVGAIIIIINIFSSPTYWDYGIVPESYFYNPIFLFVATFSSVLIFVLVMNKILFDDFKRGGVKNIIFALKIYLIEIIFMIINVIVFLFLIFQSFNILFIITSLLLFLIIYNVLKAIMYAKRIEKKSFLYFLEKSYNKKFSILKMLFFKQILLFLFFIILLIINILTINFIPALIITNISILIVDYIIKTYFDVSLIKLISIKRVKM